jgi:diguanylate cyclase (GGDEF)-like protein
MNLQEAITALQLAVDEVIRATLSDDKTPLGNALALVKVASLVGTGGDNPDVVIFGDLNRFKGLNDQFGHAAGDEAINQIGKLIQKLLVEECQALAFRRSGDEFAILLSSHSLEQFKARLPSFASCSFQFEGETLKTAMSFGYAVSQGEAGFADLLTKAETACQVAKAIGDGACVEWSEEIELQAVENLRDRCTNCGTIIRCNVPRRLAPENRKLLCCPCCGESLSDNILPMQEN